MSDELTLSEGKSARNEILVGFLLFVFFRSFLVSRSSSRYSTSLPFSFPLLLFASLFPYRWTNDKSKGPLALYDWQLAFCLKCDHYHRQSEHQSLSAASKRNPYHILKKRIRKRRKEKVAFYLFPIEQRGCLASELATV